MTAMSDPKASNRAHSRRSSRRNRWNSGWSLTPLMPWRWRISMFSSTDRSRWMVPNGVSQSLRCEEMNSLARSTWRAWSAIPKATQWSIPAASMERFSPATVPSNFASMPGTRPARALAAIFSGQTWVCASMIMMASQFPGLAAVDDEDGAGDEVGTGGGQQAGQRDELGDVSHALGGDAAHPAVEQVGRLQDRALRVSGESAGGDAVDLDVVAGPLGSQGFGEPRYGALGGGVADQSGLAADTGGRSDVDDLAAALRDEVAAGGLGQGHRGDDVHLEGGAPLLEGHGGGVGCRGHAGVVDEDVDPSVPFDDEVDEAVERLRVAQVDGGGGDALRVRGLEFAQLVGGAGCSDDERAAFSVAAGDRGPDSPARTGDEGDLAVEFS